MRLDPSASCLRHCTTGGGCEDPSQMGRALYKKNNTHHSSHKQSQFTQHSIAQFFFHAVLARTLSNEKGTLQELNTASHRSCSMQSSRFALKMGTVRESNKVNNKPSLSYIGYSIHCYQSRRALLNGTLQQSALAAPEVHYSAFCKLVVVKMLKNEHKKSTGFFRTPQLSVPTLRWLQCGFAQSTVRILCLEPENSA